MRFGFKHIFSRVRERGFTLIESVIVMGLTTLITVGVIAGLLEGLDALHTMTDQQAVEFGQQQAMQTFMADVQAAQYFANTASTVHDESGLLIPRDATEPYAIQLGYMGADGHNTWVKYQAQLGMNGEHYLIRANYAEPLPTDTGPIKEGVTVLTPGVVRLEFNYYDADGNTTNLLSALNQISMVLDLQIGDAIVEKEYLVTLRNKNLGTQEPPVDFNDLVSKFFRKGDIGI
jgi:type II secretory pathway pseudopilin PulG